MSWRPATRLTVYVGRLAVSGQLTSFYPTFPGPST